MGSFLGLTRYSGVEFKTFEHAFYDSTSLSNDVVYDLLEDHEGRLWIATDNGLNLYQPESESFRRIQLPLTGYGQTSIRHLLQTSDRMFWCATPSRIVSYSPQSGHVDVFPNFDNAHGKRVRQLVEWNHQVVALTNTGRFYVFDKSMGRFRENPLPGSNVSFLAPLADGPMWMFTSKRLFALDRELRMIKNYPLSRELHSREITCAQSDDRGFWLGTQNGLFHVDTASGAVVEANEFVEWDYLGGDRTIACLFRDAEQSLWASIQGQGLYRMSPFRPHFKIMRHRPHDPHSLSSNMIFRIYEDNDSVLWIGTLQDGLNRISRNGTCTRMQVGGGVIRSMADGNDGSLWVGTSVGLKRIDKRTGKLLPLPSGAAVLQNVAVTEMLKRRNADWVFGTSAGVAHIVFGSDQTKATWYRGGKQPNNLSSDFVFALCPSRRGGVWVGTWEGLDYLDLDHGRVSRNSSMNDNLGPGMITSVWEDSGGSVWVGTYGRGLSVYDPNHESWKVYTKRDGLPNDQVYSILPDAAGYLWLTTNNGLCRISPVDGQVQWYSEKDGIAGNEFNGAAACRRRDGSLVLGGPRGVTMFRPDQIKNNPYVPSVAIEYLQTRTSVINDTKSQWNLGPSDNSFEVSFAALSFVAPEKNRYRYILEGYDGDWMDSKHRHVAPYTNVPPGRYTFHVQAANNDGVWNREGASIPLVVLPAVWQTWWFVGLVCLGAAVSVYSLVAFRVRQLLAVERLRATIAADLHDFVGSGLTDISILTQLVAQHLDRSTRQKVDRHIQKIHDTTDGIIKSFGDIIWIVNPKRDSLTDLIVRTKDFYQDLLSQLGVQFTTSKLDDLRKLKLKLENKQQLYLLIKEAIHNSLKHSQCHRIHIDVAVSRSDFVISIADDGRGFQLNGHSGEGLTNMRTRARRLGGSLLIQSSPDTGTRIEVKGRN